MTPFTPNIGHLPTGWRGFDANVRITAAVARQFYRHHDDAIEKTGVPSGYRFAIRYVRRGQANGHDVTAGEIVTLLEARLGVMLVQHVDNPGWMPSATVGHAYGSIAAEEARGVGMPQGVTLWCDLEGVDPAATSASVINFCNAWYERVASAGYEPGLYVGWHSGLSAAQLYRNLRFTRYWSGFNLDADRYPAVRGVCMRQHAYPPKSKRVAGVPFEYDEDVIQTDALGGSPTLLLPWAP